MNLSNKALIVVDVQNDFCEGGSLEVQEANLIFDKINELCKLNQGQRPFFKKIFVTQDWHELNHVSFASNHKDGKPFVTIKLQNGKNQELWPIHCVQESYGAQLNSKFNFDEFQMQIIKKGTVQDVESYSGFGAPGEDTGLLKQLQDNQIESVYVVGLAYDYCVGSTALDAQKQGFKTFIITDCTKSVHIDSENQMKKKLNHKENYREITYEQFKREM